jgi:hypothetical protein
MRSKLLLFAALLATGMTPQRNVSAADLALVLLTDVSSSMDDGEFAMVKEGYRTAFSDPEVISAILENGRGVAVTYVEFADADNVRVVEGWDVLTDAASARAFGEAVAAAPRSATGNTALAVGIQKAAVLLQGGEFAGARRVIDVASDHPSDGGRSAAVRDRVVEAGITINALPIMDDHLVGTFDGHLTYSNVQWGAGGIPEFYRLNVIGGAGAFLIEAHNYEAFGEALKRKLLLELVADRPTQEAESRSSPALPQMGAAQ